MTHQGQLYLSHVGVVTFYSTTAITDTNWHHVAVTRENGNLRFYADGLLASTVACSVVFDLNGPFAIGALGTPFDGVSYGFLGQIDEPAVYGRALGQPELAAIHQAGAEGKCSEPATQPCTPVSAGLVAWYRGESNAGDATGLHSGTFTGPRFAAGKVGQAFDFDGSNEVVIPDAPEFNTGTFTIEAWVYPTSLDGAVDLIVNKEAGSDFSQFQFEMGIKGPIDDVPGQIPLGNLAFYLGGVAGLPDDYGGWADGRAAIPLSQWTHIALALDADTATVYVNGTATRTVTGLGGPVRSTSGPLKLGSRTDSFVAFRPQERFNGRIDEFSFYGRALSAVEVAAVFQAGSAGKCVPTLPVPVSIVSPPASQTGLAGQDAIFTVAATGTAPLTYQWRFNGADLPGATNAQLVVPAARKPAAGGYSVTVCNPAGCVTSAPATLTVTPGPAIIRALSSTTKALAILSVPIVLEANGGENAVSFTLRFDPRQLAFLGTSRSGTAEAQLLVNSAQASNGVLGVVLALPAGGKFPEGTNELLRLSFRPEPVVADSARPLQFTDSPTRRLLADADANVLPATWVNGVAQVIAADYEGDVSPWSAPDKQVTVADWVQIGRFVAGLDDVDHGGSQFQRTDCAPLSTAGNGRLTVSDWVQAGRFTVGLDPLSFAGGPLKPATPPPNTPNRGRALPHGLGDRAVSLSGSTLLPGETKDISVLLAATGEENAVAFSLSYDPAVLRFAGATVGTGATQAVLNVNTKQAADGRIGIALALTTGAKFSNGTLEITKLRFTAVVGAKGSTNLSFIDAPVFREIADPLAEALPSAWVDTVMSVALPTLTVSSAQTPDGSAIVLAWPAALAGASLESATDPASAAWTPVSAAPVVKDGQNTVTLTAPAAAGYFRLKLP